MVIKVYVAMISCSQEIKKNQQRAVMILESKNVPYIVIDITDPACEDSKDYMVETATPREGLKTPVTPQIYNEADYCGDYDALDMSNECDTLGDFLKLSNDEKKVIKIGITGIIPTSKTEEEDSHKISNGVSASRENTAAAEEVEAVPAAAPAEEGEEKPAAAVPDHAEADAAGEVTAAAPAADAGSTKPVTEDAPAAADDA